MTWVFTDDNWADSAQVLRIGPEGAWLHVCAVSWSARQLADGRIPGSMLGRLASLPDPLAVAQLLVGEGLWRVVDGGWEIVDFEHGPVSHKPREKVLATRKAKADAGRAGGRRSGVVRKAKAEKTAREERPVPVVDPPAAELSTGDEAEPKHSASSVVEPPSRRDGTKSRPSSLRDGTRTRARKRPPGSMPRDAAVVAAENDIAELSDVGRRILRENAVAALERDGGLPDGWERDESHPWEQTIYSRMVALMRTDRAQPERRTGT